MGGLDGGPGPEDGGATRDAGPPPARDAGPPPTGVCDTAATASPYGLVALGARYLPGGEEGFLGDDLVVLGIEAGGTRRELARFDGRDGEIVEIDGRALSRASSPVPVAGFLISRGPDCGWPRCDRRYDLFLWQGGREPRVVPIDDASQGGSLNGVLADGRVVVTTTGPGGGSGTTALVSPATGAIETLPRGVSLSGPVLEADGAWLPVRYLEPPDAARQTLAFARPGETEVTIIPERPIHGWPWRGRWVWFDPEEPASVVVDSGDGTRRRLPIASPGETARPVSWSWADHLELIDDFGEPVGLLDLRTGERVDFPDDVFPADPERVINRRANHDWYVAAQDGRPVIKVDLGTNEVETLSPPVLPAGLEPFDGSYCDPGPAIGDDGTVGFVARNDDAPEVTGFYATSGRGDDPTRIGHPFHDIIYVMATRRGETWLLAGSSGRFTFCRPAEPPWDDVPVPDDAVVGDRTQLVRDGDPRGPLVLPPEIGVMGLDPTGTCAFWWSPEPEPPGSLVMVDLERRAEVILDDLDTVMPVPLSAF